ncbi:hypothetical protein FLK61_26065 [Paenalkalicoccus suaedae]|uniref:Uncharacterized protein n=1 Tax=Paenalkalicoccus suaedae TaxID=2592382 RepID=A0A859FAG2_9BACI|nr:hypothetical protein [Paenalkalicoccus suaedae]QKS70229.1 hypothetical protein FLK61_26065 [Paenalkalicoccus suaedae]
MRFVEFTGKENEKEFLLKCLEQWDATTSTNVPEAIKVIHLATVFREISHRIDELD